MDNIANIEEKRRYQRVESKVPLQYRNLRKSGEASKGALSRNIGEGGLSFKSSEFISLACRLVVEITLPTSPKPIKAISKVAWIRKTPSNEQYELGNQFLEMTKEDRTHIVNFINNVLNIER
ncbi:MAG: PilZ domain-containing protein [Candidatus Omnitrophica bacterium]|nr:PilZ domain-containing protein [Candidatus Omnitrophota bacterium]MBI5143993.1 PilZ domain-containing protein [Candidatus Omnitrophota bacterium]